MVDCGAMCMPGAPEKVQELVDDAVKKGAKVHILLLLLLNCAAASSVVLLLLLFLRAVGCSACLCRCNRRARLTDAPCAFLPARRSSWVASCHGRALPPALATSTRPPSSPGPRQPCASGRRRCLGRS